MRRVPDALLQQMAGMLTSDVRDEMAIPSYLHPNPVMRWMAWRRVELLARHLEQICRRHGSISSSSPIILDFGCGTGVMLGEASCHALRVYGVDLFVDAAKILVNAWTLDNVTLVAADDVPRTIPASSLDIIIAGEVLEHLDDLRQTLSFFRSRLQPQGRLLVSVEPEPLDEEARAAWFEGFANRVNTIGRNLIVAESSGKLLIEFRRIRRAVLLLGAGYNETGEVVGLEELKKKLEA